VEDSGLRRIETNNLVNAKRFKPKAGVRCQQTDQDEQCAKEAEYQINGNLSVLHAMMLKKKT
jgi:hypothetical protein